MEQERYEKEFHRLNMRRRKMSHKIDYILRIYSQMGILVALMAGGYILLTLLNFSPSKDQQIALMLAGIGFTLTIMSKTLIELHKERESEESERIAEQETAMTLLDTWATFEKVSKETLEKNKGEFNRHSLRSVILRLHEEGKLNKNDIISLEEALRIRNLIAHGERPSSISLTQKATDSLIEIIKRIAIP